MSGTAKRWQAHPNPFDPASPAEQAVVRRVARLLAGMSLEQKVGQMIQAEIANVTPAEAARSGLGSVLNAGGSFPQGDKHASVADWLALADAYHEACFADAVPMLWGTDAVHGHSNVHGATIFPHNIGLGAAGDADLVAAIGRATAREVAATGIDWTFAPTLAVVRDDRWGRSYEGFSEHPDLVAEFAPRMVTGLQGTPGEDDFLGPGRIIATAKHFVGEGQTSDGRDQGDTACSEETLRDRHAAGHRAALAAGAQTVMAAYNSWCGEKVHGSGHLLTEVLKRRLGFDGFVVSDWNGYQQVAADHAEACARAVNAGVDMLMVGDDWRRAYHDLLQLVRDGIVSEARIDDAATRILRVKARARKNCQRPSERADALDPAVVGAAAHRDLARRAVRRSLVLLKNDGLLPLRRDATVLVAGDAADNVGKQCGGWTLTWQGTGNVNADFPNGTSIYGGIAQALDGAGSVLLRPDGECGDIEPDVAIVVFGEETLRGRVRRPRPSELLGRRFQAARDPASPQGAGHPDRRRLRYRQGDVGEPRTQCGRRLRGRMAPGHRRRRDCRRALSRPRRRHRPRFPRTPQVLVAGAFPPHTLERRRRRLRPALSRTDSACATPNRGRRWHRLDETDVAKDSPTAWTDRSDAAYPQ